METEGEGSTGVNVAVKQVASADTILVSIQLNALTCKMVRVPFSQGNDSTY